MQEEPQNPSAEDAAAGDDYIEMPPDYVGQADAAAPADAAAGGATVGEAGGPGETIEEAGEAILDSPGAAEAAFISPWMTGGAPSEPAPSEPAPSEPANAAPETAAPADAAAAEATAPDEDLFSGPSPLPPETHVDSAGKVWVPKDAYDLAKSDAELAWDLADDNAKHWFQEQKVEALADAAEDVGESVADFVEGIPVIGDDVGNALGEAYDVVEDVVDHADDPVVEDVDPWG